jgi:c-di-GMP-binding flagellar brake protein YcgR
MDAFDAILRANDLVAVLTRDVPVRLLDISASGCLLESANRFEVGTTGIIRVTYADAEYVDEVRVMRCREFDGSSALYHIGVEFLWTSRPQERSLRRMLVKLQAGAVQSGRFDQSRCM